MLPTTPERTAVCCLSSVNLETYDEWKNDSMFIYDMVRFLDNVLEHFIRHAPDTLSKAKYSASQERSLGLGAMGLHSYFQKHLIPFDSDKARAINHDIFKHIQEKAIHASENLAIEKSPAPDYTHPHDTFNKRRNVYLMAVAPNASSSILAGTSPSIEPIVANVYNHKTLSGTFVVKNKYLDKILATLPKKKYDEVWKSIFANKGSVQHLKGTGILTDEQVEVFKTAKEINQKYIIDMAADRQKFIDQGQSVNLFFSLPINGKEFSKLHMRAWKKGMKGLYYVRSEESSRAEILENVEREIITEIVKETFLAKIKRKLQAFFKRDKKQPTSSAKIEEDLPMRNTSIDCVGCD
jgi:ribonucleoside-diphosphate reductase alpha chain